MVQEKKSATGYYCPSRLQVTTAAKLIMSPLFNHSNFIFDRISRHAAQVTFKRTAVSQLFQHNMRQNNGIVTLKDKMVAILWKQ